MIVPTKHLNLQNSLLGVGAELLKRINGARTVTSLWGEVRSLPEIKTFERFTLSLDLLHSLGAIDFKDGLLRRLGK